MVSFHLTAFFLAAISICQARSDQNRSPPISFPLATLNTALPADATYLVPFGKIHRSQLLLPSPPPAYLRCNYHRVVTPRWNRIRDPLSNMDVPTYDDMYRLLYTNMQYTSYTPGSDKITMPDTGHVQRLLKSGVTYDYVIMTNGDFRFAQAYSLATKKAYKVSGHAMLASNGRIGAQKIAYAGEMKLLFKVLTLDNKSGHYKPPQKLLPVAVAYLKPFFPQYRVRYKMLSF